MQNPTSLSSGPWGIVLRYFVAFTETKHDSKLPHQEDTAFDGRCDDEHVSGLSRAYFGHILVRKNFRVPDWVLLSMLQESPFCEDYGEDGLRSSPQRQVETYRRTERVPWQYGAIATFTCYGSKYIACKQPSTDKLRDNMHIYVFMPDISDESPIASFSCNSNGYFDDYEPGYFAWNRQTEKERAIFLILDQLFA